MLLHTSSTELYRRQYTYIFTCKSIQNSNKSVFSYYKLFLYLILCVGVILDRLSCSFTPISLLTTSCSFTLFCI